VRAVTILQYGEQVFIQDFYNIAVAA